MVLLFILILLLTVSPRQTILFSIFVRIMNSSFIVASTWIIRMVYLNGWDGWSLKWTVTWFFTHLFIGKNVNGPKLWPTAISYDTTIYDHIPNDEDISPDVNFTGKIFPHHKLKDIHLWGWPIYVLDTTLQQGRKILKWHPWLFCSIFSGFSLNHSNDVPLILNPDIGHI